MNPSFYGPPPVPQSELSPWVISHDSGSTGCVFNPSSYDEAARDQYFGDPASMLVLTSIQHTSWHADLLYVSLTRLSGNFRLFLKGSADTLNSKCAFPKSGGQDRVSQEIFNMCPDLLYTLT